MIERGEWRWVVAWSAALIVASLLPYLIAWWSTPPDLFYTGFLSNPEDGNAYLAKMQQGLRGEWRYHLPYTAEQHRGEFLFTYYVLLGHVARWTRLPLIVVFHLARVVNGAALLIVLYYFISHFFQERVKRRFAFLLTAWGSGLGWLVTFFGPMTADLWVPEGYVWYSIFVNPHFPLALALLLLAVLWSVTSWGLTRPDWRRVLGVALCTAALGVVQPFCLLTVGGTLLLYALVRLVGERRWPGHEIVSGVVTGAVGLPFALNAYLVSTRNPAFAAWSGQNQTMSPPPWDFALSYGVVLLLAAPGLWLAARRRRGGDWLLLIWVVLTSALLYAPFSLQRRLVMGLVAPLGCLATMGWYRLPRRFRRRKAWLLAFAGLTHLFLLAGSTLVALSRSEILFLSDDEYRAIGWLNARSAPDALVVAAPEMGLYIPAWSGRRVFYGHRFDTAHAQERKAQLLGFYGRNERVLLREAPDYVFYGPRERALGAGDWQPDADWRVVFERGEVVVYAVPRP